MKTSTKSSIADLERIAERVLKLAKSSDAEETEVDIGATTDALTRFANNIIHQNVAEHTLGISVRTVVDGRTARATTNKTDDESLRRAVAAAVSLARNEPENPDLLPMLRSAEVSESRAVLPRDRSRRPGTARPRRHARLQNGG